MHKEEKNPQTTQETRVPATRPAVIHDDDFGADDFAYGWLRIAAANSEVVQDPEKKIEGLVAGMFFDSLSREVLGTEVKLTVLKFFRSYAEHEPGENGQFIRQIPAEEWEAMAPKREGRGYTLANGNQGREQLNYMVALADRPDLGILRMGVGPGGFASAKVWNTLIQSKGIPKHLQVWTIRSVFNAAKDKTKSAFFAIGRGSAFAGSYAGPVSADQAEAIGYMVETLAAMSGRLEAGGHESGDAAADSAAQYGTEAL